MMERERGMMPTTAQKQNRFLQYIPRFGHSLWGRAHFSCFCIWNRLLYEGNCQWEGRKLQEDWNRLLHKRIDREKRPWVLENLKISIAEDNWQWKEAMVYKRHHLLKITRREKKIASERRSCGYTKLCENYATGSKSSDIGEEVRFKTLPLLNTLPDQKEFHQIQSIAVGKKKRQS